MYAQSVPARPGAAPESLRRDASVRAGDRGRAGRRDYRGRGELSPAAFRQLEVWTRANNADGTRPFDGEVFVRLLDTPYPGFRRDWGLAGGDWFPMDGYPCVREGRARPAAGRPASAIAGNSAGRGGGSVREFGADWRDAGAHVPRIAGQADLRDPGRILRSR